MQAFSTEHILRAWENGRNRHSVDKALLLLALACPDYSTTALSNLTVGQRNALLLNLRQKTLGTRADCFAQCPRCEAPLEFTIDMETFYADTRETTLASMNTLNVDDYQICFRLPTSIDLAALVGCCDLAQGSQLLITRCVVRSERAGYTLAITDLPAQVIAALAQAMLDLEPQAEMEIQLECAECEHCWMALFDIVSFFWTELEVQAKRVLREVSILAHAYGWSEAEILTLSTARRQFYLEQIH